MAQTQTTTESETMPQPTAESVYARHFLLATEMAQSIVNALPDLPAPGEDTHWGHVGDMVRIETMLADILAVMNNTN